MSAVTHAGKGNILHSDGDTVPVHIAWSWFPTEPLIIKGTFSHPDGKVVVWEFSRELLAATLRDCEVHGELDLVAARKWPDTLMLTLTGVDTKTGADYSAVVVTTDQAVRSVITKSTRTVPIGDEVVDVDGAIELILSGAA